MTAQFSVSALYVLASSDLFYILQELYYLAHPFMQWHVKLIGEQYSLEIRKCLIPGVALYAL